MEAKPETLLAVNVMKTFEKISLYVMYPQQQQLISSSHHQEQSLSSSLVIDLSIADYFLKNNIQSLPAHRHLFHINAILSNMYDSIILRKDFFSCIMCND